MQKKKKKIPFRRIWVLRCTLQYVEFSAFEFHFRTTNKNKHIKLDAYSKKKNVFFLPFKCRLTDRIENSSLAICD